MSAPTPAKTNSILKAGGEVVVAPISQTNTALSGVWQSGELPPPLPVPAGNTDEVAAILASKVAAKNAESVPALLTALQLSGFFVTGKGGKVVLAPPDGKGQGLAINGWEIASAAKMLGDGRTTPLSELGKKFKTLELLKDADVGAYILQGIRTNAENKKNPFLRIWARFLAALGKNSPVKYDIQNAAAKPEQVTIDAVQHLLIMRRLFGDLYVLSEKFKQSPNGTGINPNTRAAKYTLEDMGVKFFNASYSASPATQPTVFPNYGSGFESAFSSPSSPFVTSQPPCRLDGDAPTVMDAAATGFGFGFGEFMGYLEEHLSRGAGEAIGKYTKITNLANIFLAYAKFLQTYAALETKISVEDKSPLVRTKNSVPGGRKRLRAEVKMDIGNWQMYNCIRLAMTLSTGLDFATLNDGPIEGVGVTWHLDEGGAGDVYNNRDGRTGGEQIVGFAMDNMRRVQDKGSSAGSSNPTYGKTDGNGVVTTMLEGTPQRNVKIGKVFPIMKNAHVRTTIKMKSGEIKGDLVDVAGQAIGGLGGIITLPVELLYRSDWISTAEADIPVKDWEECDGTGWHGAISYIKTLDESHTEKDSNRFIQTAHKIIYEATILAKPAANADKLATFYEAGKNIYGSAVLSGKAEATHEEKLTESRASRKEDFCRFTLKGGTDKQTQTCTGSTIMNENGGGHGESKVNLNFADKTYSFSFSLPKFPTQITFQSQSKCVGGCVAIPPQESAYSKEGTSAQELVSVDEQPFDPENPDAVEGSLTRKSGDFTETITWNFSRCGNS
ncbi:MAG TPA: hypothetical protein VF599_05910 [Pyrinomonadaceae bacterium]